MPSGPGSPGSKHRRYTTGLVWVDPGNIWEVGRIDHRRHNGVHTAFSACLLRQYRDLGIRTALLLGVWFTRDDPTAFYPGRR